MGRFYSGDINGKFWFGTQSSDDADFFGYAGTQPAYLEYFFEKEHKLKIINGITVCETKLGKHNKELKQFFKDHTTYNDQQLSKALKISAKTAHTKLEWYARLLLGREILKCLKKNGECNFEAEL